jgi:hypothetical protein
MVMRPSASRVPLVMVCDGPLALPTVGNVAAASDRGTVIHRYLEELVRYGKPAAFGNVPEEHADECGRIDTKEIEYLAADALPEHAMAWSPSKDTARSLGTKDRDYSGCVGDEIAGTTDLLVEKGPLSDVLRVIDYKTGRIDVPPPEDNWQMRTLAVMASRVCGVDRVQVEVWKLREDGGWWIKKHVFDSFDLDAFASEIRERLARPVTRETMRLVEGEHCRYCPAITSCPAKTQLAARLIGGDFDAAAKAGELTPEMRGRAWDQLGRAQELLDRIRRALEDVARVEPFPLPDGRTVKLVEKEREYVVGVIAREVIASEFGPEVAAACCETKVSSSKAAIQRALGKQSKRVIERLRERGGMRVDRSSKIEAVK